MTDAIKELANILELEGVSRSAGASARKEAFEAWKDRWLSEVVCSHDTLPRSGWNSEKEDFLKYYLSYKLGERLMDDCVDVKLSKHNITTQVIAFRRVPK